MIINIDDDFIYYNDNNGTDDNNDNGNKLTIKVECRMFKGKLCNVFLKDADNTIATAAVADIRPNYEYGDYEK